MRNTKIVKPTEENYRDALNKFCSAVAKKEGKTSEVSIGNIREMVRISNDMLGGNHLYNKILMWAKNADK